MVYCLKDGWLMNLLLTLNDEWFTFSLVLSFIEIVWFLYLPYLFILDNVVNALIRALSSYAIVEYFTPRIPICALCLRD